MTAHGLLRTTPLYIQTVHLNAMAKRLTVSEVVELLDADEYDDFGLSEEDNSDSEGEDVEGYLPRASFLYMWRSLRKVWKKKKWTLKLLSLMIVPVLVMKV